jgi:hypothetical protein
LRPLRGLPATSPTRRAARSRRPKRCRRALARKRTVLGRELKATHAGIDAAIDSGDWRAADRGVKRLIEFAREGRAGASAARLLARLTRVQIGLDLAIAVAQGESVPRAAAHGGGALAGAWLGARTGAALCGDLAAACGFAGGVAGAIGGEEAVNGLMDHFEDFTHAKEILHDLEPK